MKIIQLQAENVKRLSAVNITPDGSTVVIGGKNGAGKSSVLDSIMYALGGGESLPAKPLRQGTDKGQVVVKLDGMTVTRRFTRKKGGDDVSTSLEIRRENGDKAGSPQAILDDLCGRMAFDPLEFSRLKPKAQLDALKQLVGLDFTELDRKRASLFEKRTDVNRSAKAKAAELAACPKVDAPTEPVSVEDLTVELDRRQAVNRAIHEELVRASAAKQAIVVAASECKRAADMVASLHRQLEEAQGELQRLGELKKQREEDAEQLQQAAEQRPKLECDSLLEQIRNAESVNAKVRQNRQHEVLAKAHADLEGDSESLTAQIEGIDEQKSKAMAEAPFPVAGLGFDADGVTLNGLPFSQASSAEQLRVSVAMGLAVNPKLRVMLIRDGSLLDSDSLSLVAKLADESDAQVWIERVGEGEEVSVVIEDGHVKAEELAAA